MADSARLGQCAPIERVVVAETYVLLSLRQRQASRTDRRAAGHFDDRVRRRCRAPPMCLKTVCRRPKTACRLKTVCLKTACLKIPGDGAGLFAALGISTRRRRAPWATAGKLTAPKVICYSCVARSRCTSFFTRANHKSLYHTAILSCDMCEMYLGGASTLECAREHEGALDAHFSWPSGDLLCGLAARVATMQVPGRCWRN